MMRLLRLLWFGTFACLYQKQNVARNKSKRVPSSLQCDVIEIFEDHNPARQTKETFPKTEIGDKHYHNHEKESRIEIKDKIFKARVSEGKELIYLF